VVDGDKFVHERRYRDQAFVLMLLELLQPGRRLVVGPDGPRSQRDRSIRPNGLLQRSKGRWSKP